MFGSGGVLVQVNLDFGSTAVGYFRCHFEYIFGSCGWGHFCQIYNNGKREFTSFSALGNHSETV